MVMTIEQTEAALDYLKQLPDAEYTDLTEWIVTAFCTALYSVDEQRGRLGDLDFSEFSSNATMQTIASAHEHAKDLQLAISEKEQFIQNIENSGESSDSIKSPNAEDLLQVFLATKSISNYWLNVATQTRINFEERVEFLEQLQMKLEDDQQNQNSTEDSKEDDASNLATFAALVLDFYQDRDALSVSTLFSQSGLGNLQPEAFLKSDTIQKHITNKTCATIQLTVDQWCSKIESLLQLNWLFESAEKHTQKPDSNETTNNFFETLHEVDALIPTLHVELEHHRFQLETINQCSADDTNSSESFERLKQRFQKVATDLVAVLQVFTKSQIFKKVDKVVDDIKLAVANINNCDGTSAEVINKKEVLDSVDQKLVDLKSIIDGTESDRYKNDLEEIEESMRQAWKKLEQTNNKNEQINCTEGSKTIPEVSSRDSMISRPSKESLQPSPLLARISEENADSSLSDDKHADKHANKHNLFTPNPPILEDDSATQITESLNRVDEWLNVAEKSLSNSHLVAANSFDLFQDTLRRYRELHSAITQKHEGLCVIFEAGEENEQTKALCEEVSKKWYSISHKVIETCRNLTSINEQLTELITGNEEIFTSKETECNEWRLEAANDVEEVDNLFSLEEADIIKTTQAAYDIFQKHLAKCQDHCDIFRNCESLEVYELQKMRLGDDVTWPEESNLLDSIDGALMKRAESSFRELDALKAELEARANGMLETGDSLTNLEHDSLALQDFITKVHELSSLNENLETIEALTGLIDKVKSYKSELTVVSVKYKLLSEHTLMNIEQLFVTFLGVTPPCAVPFLISIDEVLKEFKVSERHLDNQHKVIEQLWELWEELDAGIIKVAGEVDKIQDVSSKINREFYDDDGTPRLSCGKTRTNELLSELSQIIMTFEGNLTKQMDTIHELAETLIDGNIVATEIRARISDLENRTNLATDNARKILEAIRDSAHKDITEFVKEIISAAKFVAQKEIVGEFLDTIRPEGCLLDFESLEDYFAVKLFIKENLDQSTLDLLEEAATA